MAQFHQPFEELPPADYFMEDEAAPSSTTLRNPARDGLQRHPASSRPGQPNTMKKKAPPVPPKRRARQLTNGDHGQRDSGYHSQAFHDDYPRLVSLPEDPPVDGDRRNVNRTSSDVLTYHPSTALRGFSYLPNTEPLPLRVQEPGTSPRPPEDTERATIAYADLQDSAVMDKAALDHAALDKAAADKAAADSETYQPASEAEGSDDYSKDSDVFGDGDQRDEDLAALEYLDNDVLLRHLMTRFEQQQPYTYIGDALVAVNPCQPLHIYTTEYQEKYRQLRVRSQAPAHIFWLASRLYGHLRSTGRSQCVVVGGESGSGKTESIKYILHHLVHIMAETQPAVQSPGPDTAPPVLDIVRKLEKVNPLLELFGNASTVLNENSSRFGKLVELEFDERGTLNTARLECFILEKFRVTSRNPVEKNFHVFYALFAGLSSQRLSELGLHLSAESYRILKPWDFTDGVFRSEEETQKYRSQCDLLNSTLPDIGFSPAEIKSVFRMLSAILLLSNVEFEQPDPDTDDVIMLDGMGEVCLENAVEVLELGEKEAKDFENSLLRLTMDIGGERVKRHKTLRQARAGRDALAREMYAVLFYGLMDKINMNLRGASYSSTSDKSASIRLLDISGFENVERHNGFEQFIINATNERMHQFFLQRVFRQELDDYVREGLTPVDVTFQDNAHIVQLIFAKPEGLIPLLEDEIAINGSDRGWLNKCARRSHPSTHFTPQSAATAFTLLHFAGKVKYSAEQFVTKNSDTVYQNLRAVVQQSDNSFIQDYFRIGSDATAILHRSGRASVRRRQNASRPTDPFSDPDGETKKAGKLTERFTDQYQKSLSGMMSKLQTDTVFIRCIKPNFHLQPHKFQTDIVRDQLLSSGILDVTKIRRDGYPVRTKFQDFVTRYKDLLDKDDVSTLRDEQEIRQSCDAILSTARVTGHQMGRSKVFLKMRHCNQLDAVLGAKLRRREKRARERQEREKREREEKTRAQREEESSEGRDDASINTTDESGFLSDRSHSKPDSDDKMDPPDKEPEPQDQEDQTEEEKEKEKKKKKKKREGLGNDPAYNIFRLTERDFENSTGFEMKIRRAVRLVLYFLIFWLVLAGGVISRLALIWLSSSQFKDTQAPDVLVILRKLSDTPGVDEFQAGLGPTRLLLCQALPLTVSWVASLGKVMFGRHDWPSFKTLILVALLDCAGVAGRSVFLFKVLPTSDFLTALVLGTAVCQVPAVLGLVSHLLVGNATFLTKNFTPRRWARVGHYVCLVLLVLAVLIQLGAVPLLIFSEDLVSAVSGTTSDAPVPDLWALVVATLCSSVGWWANYAYGKVRPHKHGSEHVHVRQGLSKWRIEMERIRKTSFVYTGPVQMVVLLSLFFAFSDGDVDFFSQIDVMLRSLGDGFSDGELMSSHFVLYSLVYLHLAATLITPYVAGIACSLYMQRVAFAVPVQLVVPTCMALVFACTPSDLAYWYDSEQCVTLDVKDGEVVMMLVVGALMWFSVLIINHHVWFPEVERTAKTDRLFFFPHRDPIFLDVCLQCSRRQDKKENAERNRQHKKLDGKFKEGVEHPKVYICATMWHELRQEMLQLLKSLFRVDFDVYTRRKAMSQFQILEEYSDIYDPEIHIIFDDAFETDGKSKQRVLNSWVRQFIEVMPEALGSVAKRNIDLQPPRKIPTPFGGRLLWTLPGGTLMYVHLKDKDKIRHRKRWSQVLYLYYLLGYRLMADYRTVDDALHAGESVLKHRRLHRVRKNTSLLNSIAPAKVRQAENIFLMTLDGDVDFRPEAVRLLLDRMKKNKKVAAVCGRIHPIGDGPMVWYQKFEYAVGHWLQKAAEHVFGCVLCCPGCFSLFRGSALMDDNVMRMYTTEPTEALHFIQYEQGEDRWLCTLLLQQGWKIEYCAGADAQTFAPETFHDFYIQRRRWSPSTLANIMDLIGSWQITVKMNDNISVLFMLYQFVLMISSIIAPGLVVFLIAESYHTVLSIDLAESYVLSVVPVFLYILLCLKAKTQTQINVAAVMSAVYAIIMLVVTIGTIINITSADILSPDVLFLAAVVTIFIFAGITHPNELFCLGHGLLYYLTVPSTFVFLTVFFLCNLHVVSWGTREGPKKVEPEADQPPVQEKGKLYKFFEKLGITAIVQDIKTFFVEMIGIRDQVQAEANKATDGDQNSGNVNQPARPKEPPQKKRPPAVAPKPKPEPAVEPDPKFWVEQLNIPNSTAGEIEEEETEFWKFLIDEYLHPIKANKEKQDKISEDLLSARNNVVFAYMLLNLMFTLVLLQLRLQRNKLEDRFYIAGEYEPVSTLSLLLFSILLLIQFCGMLGHRWGTFLHLIASTRIMLFQTNEEEERALTAIQEAQNLTSANAVGDIDLLHPDYSDTEDDTTEEYTSAVSDSSSRRSVIHIDPEDAPDYSDSGEDEFPPAKPSVQYDDVFNSRFKSVRRHIKLQQRPATRTGFYEKNPSAAMPRSAFVPRNLSRVERRQSLYVPIQQSVGKRRSIFPI